MISYNVNIPDAPNNPSNDQPLMKTNTNAINTIWAVDHVSFNVTNPPDGGTHKQVTFSTKNTPGAQTDPQSVMYTASGTASTIAETFFRNQNGTFLISCIKAFGVFTGTGVNGPVALDMGINVTSVTRVSSTSYTVALTANAMNGTTAIVLATSSNKVHGVGWSLAANTLFLSVDIASVGEKISFAILQV